MPVSRSAEEGHRMNEDAIRPYAGGIVEVYCSQRGLLLEAARAKVARSTRLAPAVAGAGVARKMANISNEDPIRQVRFDSVT
jgi:hypothetical protein